MNSRSMNRSEDEEWFTSPKLESSFQTSSKRKKRLIMTKSSMVGALGVVPEETFNDDTHLNESQLAKLNMNSLQKWLRWTKKWAIFCNDKPVVSGSSMVIQWLYILIVLIYFFLSRDVDEENIYSFGIIMTAFLLIILVFQTFAFIHKGCHTMIFIDYSLIVILVCTEILEIKFRLQSNFNAKITETGIKILLGVNRVLRVIMVCRRMNDIMIIINNRLIMLIDFENKGPKEILLNLISKLPHEETFIIVTLHHVISLLEVLKIPKRLSKISNQIRSSTSLHNSSRLLNLQTYQKDINNEIKNDIDREIYNIIPDDEDIEKIFICEEIGEDLRYSKILSNIENLDFNIFELKSLSQGNELVLVINHLMEINQFFDKLKIVQEKFRKYSVVIQNLYNPVSYHNKTHAADVCQTTYYFLTYCDFYNIGEISDMEAAVLLISAFVHDTDHPGVNNLYLVNTRDKLALRYNDKSVLENHHISQAFNTMLKSKETSIYENFTNEQFKLYREYMIDLVLATDNANHVIMNDKLKRRKWWLDFDPKGEDKKLILSIIIHLSDISNPTKPWRLWYKWIDLLFLEFFKQGDREREKGLPITFLMDRNTTNIAKAQGGFIDHFVKPAYELIYDIMPNLELNMKFWESNKEQWALLEESYSVQNDPQVNFKNEIDIIDESEYIQTESEDDSISILQKDLKWRKRSIMVAKKKGSIVAHQFLKKPRMSNFEKGVIRTFTGESSDIQSISGNISNKKSSISGFEAISYK